MKRIRLAILGDVHYPSSINQMNIDAKDKEFPKILGRMTSPNRLRNSLRALTAETGKRNLDSLLICGDLTDRGDIDGYRKCISHMFQVLNIGPSKFFTEEKVHCVPGNHDIDRSSYTQPDTEEDLWRKFQPLSDEWRSRNIDILATDKIRTITVKSGAATAEVISINSCVGCGEYRFFPTDKITEMLDLLGDNHRSDRAFEQLDTPAFCESHLRDISSHLSNAEGSSVAVILGHHNLLPQATPRLEAYTELINGGLLREQLVSNLIPTIYCHGHIHDDPIEILQSRHDRKASLVSISMPKLEDGFTILEIHYNDKGGPLGCIVERHMASRSGDISCGNPFRISFTSPADYCTAKRSEIDQILEATFNTDVLYFGKLKDIIHTTMKKKLHTKTIIALLEEAEWYGLISITNRDKKSNPERWKITRCIP